ncbi:MAG: SRPBCC family protein [Bacteroidota bacterium]
MKILKKILIVLVVIVAVLAIAGMFMSPKVRVERSMEMKASPEAVYSQVADLKMWDNWMPWNKMDPAMVKTYGDKTMGEGATYSWVSNNKNVGKGSIVITKAVPNEMVETTLSFDGQGDATGGYQMEKTDAGTKVTWSMNMDMGSNPFKRLMGSMMDKMMGPYFDQGLHSLDSASSAMPAPAPMMENTEMPAADSSASMAK